MLNSLDSKFYFLIFDELFYTIPLPVKNLQSANCLAKSLDNHPKFAAHSLAAFRLLLWRAHKGANSEQLGHQIPGDEGQNRR